MNLSFYNLLKTLTEGSKQYDIAYGVDDQRRKSVYKVGTKAIESRYYLGNYEEVTDSLGRTTKIHYLGDAILNKHVIST